MVPTTLAIFALSLFQGFDGLRFCLRTAPRIYSHLGRSLTVLLRPSPKCSMALRPSLPLPPLGNNTSRVEEKRSLAPISGRTLIIVPTVLTRIAKALTFRPRSRTRLIESPLGLFQKGVTPDRLVRSVRLLRMQHMSFLSRDNAIYSYTVPHNPHSSVVRKQHGSSMA